jgi:alpha-D-xyloside xylohydrolase
MDGYTLMRPLVFDFPNDNQALEQVNEYMFGSSILVNPVTDKGVTAWRTYLPKQETGWYDFWTGKWYAGDQWVDVAVNIEKMPIFIKAGSILPMGQDKQSVVEKKEGEPITLTIYPGADATFTLYEDEGDNYNYESGKYSLIKFSWDDKKKRLTAHGREGSFEGMPTERIFVVKMGAKELSMLYSGKKMSVSF